MVRPNVHTNPSWKCNFSKSLFKPEEFVNATSFLCGGETFWKRRYSTENDGVTIIMRFIWPIFLHTQIQNGRWLLRFSFLWRSVNGKQSMRFSEWHLRFHIPPAKVDGALNWAMFLITCFTFLLRCYETKHRNKLYAKVSSIKSLNLTKDLRRDKLVAFHLLNLLFLSLV